MISLMAIMCTSNGMPNQSGQRDCGEGSHGGDVSEGAFETGFKVSQGA